MQTEQKYPIKAVSLKTGLTIHVIRVWEKRYQVVKPQRTETNRRLYTDKDIAKLSLLKKATLQGHNIGSIASLEINELIRLVSDTDELYDKHTELSTQNSSEATYYVDESISTIKNFNAQKFEKILLNASLQLSQPVFLDSVIIPVIKKIGDLWHSGEIRIMNEHMATTILMTFLSNMRDSYRPEPDSPSVIVTTPLGQNHELGALILSLVAATEGWNVTYLGPNLPAEEIASAVTNKKASTVILSIVYPADDHYLKQDLLKLKGLLPKNTSIIVGGRLAKNYKTELENINARIVDDLSGFRKISSELIKANE
jgi:MerR family transcriptional regulator, light-induced transcriptional regulator